MTVGIGLFVGLVVFFSADVPDEFFSDRLIPYAALLAALAATVGLLVSWGELDLSVFGILAVGGYIYADVSDSSVAAAIVLSALAGLFVGVVIGVLRWLTRAPSGVLSLGGGMAASIFYVRVSDLAEDGRGPRLGEGVIDGPWVHIVAGFVFVAAATLLAAVLGRPGQGQGFRASNGSVAPGARVIAGFALSGTAAGVVGAVFLGWQPMGPPTPHWSAAISFWLLPLFAAVAVGGVLRGSWFIAPIGAGLGAAAVTLMDSGAVFHDWDRINAELLLAAFLLGSLVVSYGLHRVLGGDEATGQVPPNAIPPSPPGQPVPF